MITIKRADYDRAEDAEAIIVLMDAYAQDPMGGGQPLSDYSRKNLATKLKQHNAVTLLAWDGQRPVAILNAFFGFSTFACRPLLNVHDLAVLKNYRGRGLSRLLLTELESVGRNHDCCKLTLEVLSGNERAQAAYQSFGFSRYQLDPTQGQAFFWEKKL
ncbi:GNAT family N-acetyltransferase [Gilvimarinus agarilyticus]|uniref:GNAT family N-acetyltransferase n=1 Tax=unclassified Gilvimarinus TaxID=2642066 RepID=UPI001C0946DA|nr:MULTISPECIES: GNAT family N-acetyltransferase [unclassified Gilvimarinus]MBU2887807.1 GNAT family N-acetyltransferase [Gilvimarinus agarilyticus]MDO6572446.1 GNAT family N-acetyltransferase [Gilvimarinus sp. 2_MG-2023]MDO6746590.1 GNAT family N-acetyltransferase [Gilvimarinus sp. 1_MG-2023]